MATNSRTLQIDEMQRAWELVTGVDEEECIYEGARADLCVDVAQTYLLFGILKQLKMLNKGLAGWSKAQNGKEE